MKTFEEIGINAEVLKAITEMGFENPMPVQEEVIPYLLSADTDVVALAQTGTGKTAAFGLPVIQKTEIENVVPQTLILCPTRELCLQIAGDLQDFSKYIRGLHILPVYGGSSIESQIRSLKKGVHIIVATPGRLLDLMNRKTVDLSHVRYVIMDEADEMLNMGFTDSINSILAEVPETRNTLLFSATMPAEIARISKKYMKNPKEITIGHKNEGNKNVKHVYYMVHAKDKYAALKRIADYYPSIYGIVFCRTRRETQEIADMLIQDGYNADSLHGELSQAQRDAVMQKFRVQNIQLLVATDVAARGLDVDNLTHVINYGLPDDVETYTHRSGRTGRAGKSGISIAIMHVREKGRMRDIERMIQKKFEKGTVPSGEQICEKQLFNLADRLEKVKVDEEEIAQYLDPIYKKLEWLSTEDLIKRVVSLEFNRLLEYYKGTPELDIPDEGARRSDKEGRQDGGRNRRQAESGFNRIFINLGKTDGLFPANLIELINKNVKRRVEVGKIDILQNFSFFEVPENDTRFILQDMSEATFENRIVSVEVAQDKKDKGSSRGSFRNGGRGGDRRSFGDRRSNSGNRSDRGGYNSSRGNGRREYKDRDSQGTRTERRR
ncbi:MAG: DEAD/DEAH box helicase [Bacteroidales bacterium]|nr:DEAD/DEAH box helicase [Bacteroidales bacterium]